MNNPIPTLLLAGAMMLAAGSVAIADSPPPWGGAAAPAAPEYAPQKVVYDVAAAGAAEFEGVLDRVSFLNTVYHANPFDASIVVVLHGNEIPLFAIRNYPGNQALMARVHSLTQAGPIEFRMCAAAARARGYQPGDIHGFVRMVPMADAELVKLQRVDGYAYMR